MSSILILHSLRAVWSTEHSLSLRVRDTVMHTVRFTMAWENQQGLHISQRIMEFSLAEALKMPSSPSHSKKKFSPSIEARLAFLSNLA